MEALCDAIVFCEPPHGRQGFASDLESLREGDQRGKGALLEISDELQQGLNQGAAGPFGLVLDVHERAQGMHLFIQRLVGGISGKKLRQTFVIPRVQIVFSFPQGTQQPTVVLCLLPSASPSV